MLKVICSLKTIVPCRADFTSISLLICSFHNTVVTHRALRLDSIDTVATLWATQMLANVISSRTKESRLTNFVLGETPVSIESFWNDLSWCIKSISTRSQRLAEFGFALWVVTWWASLTLGWSHLSSIHASWALNWNTCSYRAIVTIRTDLTSPI